MRETAEPAPQLTAEEIDAYRRLDRLSPIPQLIATIDSLRTQLAEAQGRETALREALEVITDPQSAGAMPEGKCLKPLWEVLPALAHWIDEKFPDDPNPVMQESLRQWGRVLARALSGEQA